MYVCMYVYMWIFGHVPVHVQTVTLALHRCSNCISF